MDGSTIINIAQYVLSALVLPALWFIIKLWNNHSLLSKEVQKNVDSIAEAKLTQKEFAAKQEEKETKREDFERRMEVFMAEQSKDIHYIKEKLK